MIRWSALLLLACVLAPAAETDPTAGIDRLVALFNPDILALDPGTGRPLHPISDAFTAPATDIARDVTANNNFQLLIFLPFLVLPIVLLLYVIWRFRDRGDGRPAATFTGHHTLEIVWTAIPIAALVVVGIPVWGLIWKMELPPEGADALTVEVRGRQYRWDYNYLKEGIGVGVDPAGGQEPLVLPKGRTVVLNITSDDVNHAWWVPAFGVKNDAIIGRYTNCWFTPERLGTYKGQCAELCGQGHGIMWVSAVVCEPADFATWLDLQAARGDALAVWEASGQGESALVSALDAYLAKGSGADRLLALRYWPASAIESQVRVPPRGMTGSALRTELGLRRAAVEEALRRRRGAGKA